MCNYFFNQWKCLLNIDNSCHRCASGLNSLQTKIAYIFLHLFFASWLVKTYRCAITKPVICFQLGLFVIPAANIPMLMFSEFFIPYREMPVYLRPFATISYFRYAFDAFLETVYGLGRGKLPCYEVFCMFKDPSRHLEYLGLSRNLSADFSALVIWIVLLQISLVFVLLLRVYKACR